MVADKGGRKRSKDTIWQTIVKLVFRRGEDGKKRRELRTTKVAMTANLPGPSTRAGRGRRSKNRSRSRRV